MDENNNDVKPRTCCKIFELKRGVRLISIVLGTMSIVSMGLAVGSFASEKAIGIFDLLNCLILLLVTCKIHGALNQTSFT